MGSILCPKKQRVTEATRPLIQNNEPINQEIKVTIQQHSSISDQKAEKNFIANLKCYQPLCLEFPIKNKTEFVFVEEPITPRFRK
jgi:hypothetical protein